jgi:hypothetical protein
MKAVLEGAGYKLSITDPAFQASFTSFIEAGRYRDRGSLQKSYSIGGSPVTYTELIAIIAWELAENQPLLPALEIKSWESFMNMLETACLFEAEVGKVSKGVLCNQGIVQSRDYSTDNSPDIVGDPFPGVSQALPRGTAVAFGKLALAQGARGLRRRPMSSGVYSQPPVSSRSLHRRIIVCHFQQGKYEGSKMVVVDILQPLHPKLCAARIDYH